MAAEAGPSTDAVVKTLDRALSCFAETTARQEWRKAEGFLKAAIELAKVLGSFGELEE